MQTVEYRVKSGDTLSGIARQHQVSVDALSRLNGLSDLHHIQPGQVLAMKRFLRLLDHEYMQSRLMEKGCPYRSSHPDA
jgi:LysM repeat protein